MTSWYCKDTKIITCKCGTKNLVPDWGKDKGEKLEELREPPIKCHKCKEILNVKKSNSS